MSEDCIFNWCVDIFCNLSTRLDIGEVCYTKSRQARLGKNERFWITGTDRFDKRCNMNNNKNNYAKGSLNPIKYSTVLY